MTFRKGTILKTTFEEYQITKQIGAGGAGKVYAVTDIGGDRYAIKVLDGEKASGSKLKRFKNEINFCSSNKHPNIIQILGTGRTSGGIPFYVMPLYDGTLRSVIDGDLPPEELVRLFGQILDGVEAAHLQGIWHRDLKPENVLWSEQGRLVVADFGIAHFEEDALLTAVETKPGDRLANFVYAAPEQRVKGKDIDEKADVYSLGLILNEMFTHEVPFGARYRKIAEIAPQFSYLDGSVETMLDRDATVRPSIAELKRDLIARGNASISVQRLNALKTQVISESEVDDPFITNPISIQSVDFENDLLHFKLTARPSSQWIAAFQRPQYYSSSRGPGPDYYSFHQNVASVRFEGGDAQVITNSAREFVDRANERYRQDVENAHRERIQNINNERKRAIEAEERRQQILASVKL